MISVGAKGVISVIGNALPRLFGDMVHTALLGGVSKAALIHLRLHNLNKLLFEQGNPVGVKCALSHLGICGNNLRLPLVPASADLANRIANELVKLS